MSIGNRFHSMLFGRYGSETVVNPETRVNFSRHLAYPELEGLARYLSSSLRGEVTFNSQDYTRTFTYSSINPNSQLTERARTGSITGLVSSESIIDMTPFLVLENREDQRIMFTGIDFQLITGQTAFNEPQLSLILNVKRRITDYFENKN